LLLASHEAESTRLRNEFGLVPGKQPFLTPRRVVVDIYPPPIVYMYTSQAATPTHATRLPAARVSPSPRRSRSDSPRHRSQTTSVVSSSTDPQRRRAQPRKSVIPRRSCINSFITLIMLPRNPNLYAPPKFSRNLAIFGHMNHDLILMHDLMNLKLNILKLNSNSNHTTHCRGLPGPAAASRGRRRDIKDTVLRDGVYINNIYKAGMTAHSASAGSTTPLNTAGLGYLWRTYAVGDCEFHFPHTHQSPRHAQHRTPEFSRVGNQVRLYQRWLRHWR
jgi:hypothetical protein